MAMTMNAKINKFNKLKMTTSAKFKNYVKNRSKNTLNLFISNGTTLVNHAVLLKPSLINQIIKLKPNAGAKNSLAGKKTKELIKIYRNSYVKHLENKHREGEKLSNVEKNNLKRQLKKATSNAAASNSRHIRETLNARKKQFKNKVGTYRMVGGNINKYNNEFIGKLTNNTINEAERTLSNNIQTIITAKLEQGGVNNNQRAALETQLNTAINARKVKLSKNLEYLISLGIKDTNGKFQKNINALTIKSTTKNISEIEAALTDLLQSGIKSSKNKLAAAEKSKINANAKHIKETLNARKVQLKRNVARLYKLGGNMNNANNANNVINELTNNTITKAEHNLNQRISDATIKMKNKLRQGNLSAKEKKDLEAQLAAAQTAATTNKAKNVETIKKLTNKKAKATIKIDLLRAELNKKELNNAERTILEQELRNAKAKNDEIIAQLKQEKVNANAKIRGYKSQLKEELAKNIYTTLNKTKLTSLINNVSSPDSFNRVMAKIKRAPGKKNKREAAKTAQLTIIKNKYGALTNNNAKKTIRTQFKFNTITNVGKVANLNGLLLAIKVQHKKEKEVIKEKNAKNLANARRNLETAKEAVESGEGSLKEVKIAKAQVEKEKSNAAEAAAEAALKAKEEYNELRESGEATKAQLATAKKETEEARNEAEEAKKATKKLETNRKRCQPRASPSEVHQIKFQR